jgi:Holliday junction resolvasome RuvABC ATP-dependent DNA helicase subunit
VNQKISGYGPHAHLTNLLDHEILSIERIHRSMNTSLHKVKHEALSQFNIEAGMLVNESTNRSVQFHYFRR